MGPEVFIKAHPLQNRRLPVRRYPRFRRADDDFEHVRFSAVLEPLLHSRSGEYRPQRGFDGVFRPQPPVNAHAVPDGLPLDFDRIGIVVPIHMQIIGQHVKRLFVQFVNPGVYDVLPDLLDRPLQLLRNDPRKGRHGRVVFQGRGEGPRIICRMQFVVIHFPHPRS